MLINTAEIREAIAAFNLGRAQLTKMAFVPGPAPQGPAAGGPPPGDPNMMPPPPGDPNMMPPPGDPSMMPPPGGDPNAMPPGPPPPGGDPNMMPPPPGGAPPPPGQGGGMPPELEQVLTDMAGGMQQISQTVEQQQATVEQLGSRQLEIENKLQELMQSLNGPAPFEGSTKSQQDVEAQAGAAVAGAPA